MKLRNEITAHTDADDHIYATRVTIIGGIPINHSVVTNLIPFMPKVIAESTKELQRTITEIGDSEKHIISLNLPDGVHEGS